MFSFKFLSSQTYQKLLATFFFKIFRSFNRQSCLEFKINQNIKRECNSMKHK